MKDFLSKDSVPFTQVPNELINDKRLTAKAKGVYCYMFAKPADWQFYMAAMIKDFKDGRDAIYSALSDLKALGWLSATQIKDDSGRFSHTHYHIYSTVTGKSVHGETVDGKADTTNIDSSNTNPTNTCAPPDVKPSPKPQPTPRKRNALMDALASVEGDPSEITKSRWGAIAKVLAEIVEVCPDVKPSDIERRAAAYKRKFPKAAITATALAKHWGSLGFVPLNHTPVNHIKNPRERMMAQ